MAIFINAGSDRLWPDSRGGDCSCQGAGSAPGANFFDIRTELSENGLAKGAEFERRVQKLARRKKITCQFVADRGKGSHGRLYFGEECTTLKDRKKEIGRDLLAKMCRDLTIDPHDL